MVIENHDHEKQLFRIRNQHRWPLKVLEPFQQAITCLVRSAITQIIRVIIVNFHSYVQGRGLKGSSVHNPLLKWPSIVWVYTLVKMGWDWSPARGPLFLNAWVTSRKLEFYYFRHLLSFFFTKNAILIAHSFSLCF